MMADAIERVCAMPADANRLRIVTFMTDGFVGNDLEVLGLVKKLRALALVPVRNWQRRQPAPDRRHGASRRRRGGGTMLLTSSGDEAGKRFYDRIASPVLTGREGRVAGLLDVVDINCRTSTPTVGRASVGHHARYHAMPALDRSC